MVAHLEEVDVYDVANAVVKDSGQPAVIAFDLEGVAVSSGAACSSGKVQPSHVLAAMGVVGPLLRGAVRVSLGWDTAETDVEKFLAAWRKLATALSKVQRGIAA